MADSAEAGTDAQITFKVKASSDKTHTLTLNENASVKDLKEKLSGEEYENIPIERQRLIYSGRVMKNEDTLVTYKIKPNNTIHLVKSAASNPGQPAASSNPTSNQPAPTNMASGTANNPLAGLTGARYAGHSINLPGMDMFGPDGGMAGGGMDEDRMQRMMEDPNVQSQMNEALSNPDFVNMLIESNPMLRNMPNAREMITSPFMRSMMTNPSMMRQAMNMQRGMRGGQSAFPAPGATDESGANAENTQNQQAPPLNPFTMGGMPGFGGAGGNEGGQPDFAQMAQQLQSPSGMMNAGRQQQQPGATATGDATGNTTGQTPAQGQNPSSPPPANPFAALFGPPGGGAGGAGGAGGENPFGVTPEMMQQMSSMFGMGGGAGASPAAPADNRPPEERYADQLQQLNDMGFFDFDRNVTALRRSGGSVQGAVEYLLTALD